MATPADVAQWMLDKLNADKNKGLYQDIAYTIRKEFGEEFVYDHEISGALCISKKVLRAFGKLTGDTVVYERREQYWRLREKGDLPGRQQ